MTTNSMYYEIITMVNLATVCPTHSYYNVNDHIFYDIYYIPETCLFYNWRFLPLNPFHLSYPLPPFPSGNHPFVFCTYKLVFILFHFIFYILHINEII